MEESKVSRASIISESVVGELSEELVSTEDNCVGVAIAKSLSEESDRPVEGSTVAMRQRVSRREKKRLEIRIRSTVPFISVGRRGKRRASEGLKELFTKSIQYMTKDVNHKKGGKWV